LFYLEKFNVFAQLLIHKVGSSLNILKMSMEISPSDFPISNG